MKISIIMPAYNGGKYIRKAIDSVLAQPYADKELIVIDGASSDDTVDTLKSYGSAITWISEPDQGQADAINKGLRRATGDIVTWLNADDFYEPHIFDSVATVFREHPDVVLVYGMCRNVTERGTSMLVPPRTLSADMLIRNGNFIYQPSSFYRRSTVEEIGGIDDSFNYWMEYELFIQLMKRGRSQYLDMILSNFLVHEGQKSNTKNLLAMDAELRAISRRHGGGRLNRVHLRAWYHRLMHTLGLL